MKLVITGLTADKTPTLLLNLFLKPVFLQASGPGGMGGPRQPFPNSTAHYGPPPGVPILAPSTSGSGGPPPPPTPSHGGPSPTPSSGSSGPAAGGALGGGYNGVPTSATERIRRADGYKKTRSKNQHLMTSSSHIAATSPPLSPTKRVRGTI